MSKPSPTQLKVLQDLERHILYSFDFEQYSHSLLEFLRKKMGAATIFLAFWDPQKRLEQNPLVSGRKMTASLIQKLSQITNRDSLALNAFPGKQIFWNKIVLHKSILGWMGLVFERKKKPAPVPSAILSNLCENLKRDFYFIREQMAQAQRVTNLNTIYHISQAVSETLDLDKLLDSIAESAKKLLKAEASSLAVVDPTSGELVFTVTKGSRGKILRQRRIKMGQGIIGSVAESGKPLLIEDTRKDKRFFGEIDSQTGFVTRSVLCVPMKVSNNIVGALEILNPTDRKTFSANQVAPLSALAQEAAVSIENARLFHIATTDGLTGLATIRYFRTLLENEMVRAARYDHPLSLVMLDIDFFKKVNDTYGHPTGDLILRELARTIRGSIRQIDVAARYGGEEFILLLPESPHEEAITVAQRLRQKVQKTTILGNGRSYNITISLGVVTMAHGDDMNGFIARVDQKLYEAKNSGRNKVCF